MSQKKEVYTLAKNKKGQFHSKGGVRKEIGNDVQDYLNERLTTHIGKLYDSVNRLKWAVFALLFFDVIMTYAFVNFSKQIITYLGGL